ncbi:MAG: hypothetical protein HW388_206 [Dehalococcoidia bacterium]|nr:hypothetical protein [Dehalococcoidia bacterium]
MATKREYTWKDMEDAIGQDFSDGKIHWGVEPLEWTSIRRFCEPIEMDCPLYFSDEVARQHGYQGIPCPLSMVQSVAASPIWKPGDPTRWPVPERNFRAQTEPEPVSRPMPAPKTAAGFVTDIEKEYLQPVYLGDRLGRRGNKLISVLVRETSVGKGAFYVSESQIVNQREEVVALFRSGMYRFNPYPKEQRPSREEVPGRPSAPKERVIPPARASDVDWSKQRYYEDVKVGDEVPAVTMHLTVQRLVIEAGANRDFSPHHHNTESTQAEGIPEMFMNNGFVQAMWERTYQEYIGLDGVVKKVGPFRMRIFNTVGDSIVTRGVVKGKRQETGENLVELEIWSESSRGTSVGPGPVLVTLPSKPPRR